VRDQRFGQLDALRAFAVLAVVAHHTLDVQRQAWASYGARGVQLFFVISGFLITGILIDARSDAETLGAPNTRVLRSFYARRALRIFPLYYVTVAIGTVIGIAGMHEHLGWNLLYLSNWRIALDGHWGTATHVWSLAVEEQFYLFWPLVVLLAPRRLLPWAIGSMIVVAVGTRVMLTAETDMWSDGINIITPAVLDSLGLGALLAVLWRASSNADRIVTWIGALAAAVFAVGLAATQVSALPDVSSVTDIWWALLFVWIVHQTARGVSGRLGQLLTWRSLAYVGTVSYGIYLFHLFVVPMGELVERKTGFNIPIPDRGPMQFVTVAAVSIVAASLSWTLFERPINDKKRHFPYVQASAAATRKSGPSPEAAQGRPAERAGFARPEARWEPEAE
jgi:peptidoglycan/LPS O-acetylase OafA/YrhL